MYIICNQSIKADFFLFFIVYLLIYLFYNIVIITYVTLFYKQ